jgi:ABC-type transport system involved in multi-copper enzyme maturation permease subunit
MLWHKSWLETRWRFLIGLALLVLSAGGSVLLYPQMMKLIPLGADLDLGGEIGRQVAQSIELARTYRGYIWSQWFFKNMPQQWILFAVLLGSGGLLAQSTSGTALFTLSLPITRTHLLAVRAATALAELLVLALVPSLLVSLLSPLVGESYSAADALVHGFCIFVGGTVFFSLAFLLSTVFADVWRPIIIAVCAAGALSIGEQLSRAPVPYSIYKVMSAEAYFRGTGLPWLGLFLAAVASLTMLYAASRNIARQDF